MLRHTLIEHDGESIEGGFPVLNRHIQMRKWRETHLQMRTPGGNGFRVIGLLLGFVAIFHSTNYLCIELLLINHRGVRGPCFWASSIHRRSIDEQPINTSSATQPTGCALRRFS